MIIAYIISAIILLIGAGLIAFILIRDKKMKNKNQGEVETQKIDEIPVNASVSNQTEILDDNVVKTVYLNKEDNFSGTEFLPVPEKMSNEDFDFEFAGWDKNYVDENGNKVVKAIFIQKPKQMSLFDENIQTSLEPSIDEIVVDDSVENNESLTEVQDEAKYDLTQEEIKEENQEIKEETQEIIENNLEEENVEENVEKDPFEGLVFESKVTSNNDKDLEQLFDEVEEFINLNFSNENSEIDGNGNPLENDFYQEPEIGEDEVIEEVKVNEENEDFISTQNTSFHNNFNEENSIQEKDEEVSKINSTQTDSQNNVKIENTDKLFNQIHLGRTNSSNFVGTTRNKNGFKIQMNENYQNYPAYTQSMKIDVDNKSSSSEIDDIFKRMGVNMPKTSSSQYSNNPQTSKNENFYNNIQYNSVMNGPFKSRKMELNRAKFEEMQAEMEKNQPKPVEDTSTEQFLSSIMLVNKKKINK